MTIILHIILTVSEKYVTTSAILLFGLYTAARDWPEPNTDTPERLNRDRWEMFLSYCGLGLTAAAVALCFFITFIYSLSCLRSNVQWQTQQDHCGQFD